MRRPEGEKIVMSKASLCLRVLLLACLAGVAARGQALTEADKSRALDYLESTKKGVLEATKGLSAAQWSFKPGPDRWSVAEVMEHIAAAEDLLRGVAEQTMKSPAVPARDAAEVKKIDETVLTAVPDRSHKAQAPEPLRPTNRFGSPQEAQKHFVQTRAETEAFLKNTPELRAHLADSPLGKLDGYEWVLLIAAHSERHTKQILEVKADPSFPAK
jgi:DinB family protein